ncbi:hypothetical protein LCGC14_0552480 [marine sediment metagenome]|uniref:Uncharacterized protein n=1 Tax=marine sediment metagenome TaxID=412755 RepID=A0A0F9RPI5_9ZZZZ
MAGGLVLVACWAMLIATVCLVIVIVLLSITLWWQSLFGQDY